MPTGELGGSDDTLMASPWGTQESGAGGLRVDVQAVGSDKRKAPSATANEAETQGCHRARQGQGGHDGGRRGKVGAEPSGVGGNNGGREASGVNPKPHGVVENPKWGHHGVGVGFESPQGANTPRVAEGPREDRTLGAPTASHYRRG